MGFIRHTYYACASLIYSRVIQVHPLISVDSKENYAKIKKSVLLVLTIKLHVYYSMKKLYSKPQGSLAIDAGST